MINKLFNRKPISIELSVLLIGDVNWKSISSKLIKANVFVAQKVEKNNNLFN